MRICAILASHNRKQQTIQCLSAYFSSKLQGDCHLSAVLVDDGSTDGTVDAVRSGLFADIEVICGDGSLFWNRAMHEAQKLAAKSNPDFVLWLNDDTTLDPGALQSLLDTHNNLLERSVGVSIVVGTSVDPRTLTVTYGGSISKSRLRRFSYTKVWDAEFPVECEAMNGNIVLVPRVILRALKNIDPFFEHAMGDTDYALRARMKGFKVFVSPGISGRCAANPIHQEPSPVELTFVEKWQRFTSRKRLPPRSWLHFVRRHGGMLWPVYFLFPYVKFVMRTAFAELRR